MGGMPGGTRADPAASTLSPGAAGIAHALFPRRGHAGRLLRGRRWLSLTAAVPFEQDVLPSHTLLALFIFFSWFLSFFIIYIFIFAS